jgi:hypothetical protein
LFESYRYPEERRRFLRRFVPGRAKIETAIIRRALIGQPPRESQAAQSCLSHGADAIAGKIERPSGSPGSRFSEKKSSNAPQENKAIDLATAPSHNT